MTPNCYSKLLPDGVAETLFQRTGSIFEVHIVASAKRLARSRGDPIATSRRLLRKQEQERGRLAREFHDQFGPLLAIQHVHLERAMKSVRAGSLQRALEELKEALRISTCLTEVVRQVQMSLRPQSLDDFGLAAAVQSLCDVFRRAGLDVVLDIARIGRLRFSGDVEMAAFRIVEHALTNVLRHSGVRTAKAKFETLSAPAGGMLRITIEDTGRGFVPANNTHRVGMAAMRDRAALVGGTLIVEAAPGQGSRIIAELPTRNFNIGRTGG